MVEPFTTSIRASEPVLKNSPLALGKTNMLNIQKATPIPTEWFIMQVTDLAMLAEFDKQFPGKIKEKDGTWFTLYDWVAIKRSDWIVWDDDEPANVYSDENFHQYMTIIE